MMDRGIAISAPRLLACAALPALRAAPALRDKNATGTARSTRSAPLPKVVGVGRIIKAVLHLSLAVANPHLMALSAIYPLRQVAFHPVLRSLPALLLTALPTVRSTTLPTVLMTTPLRLPHRAMPIRRVIVNTWFPMNGAMVSPALSASPTMVPVQLTARALIGAIATARQLPMHGMPLSPATTRTPPATLAGMAAFSRDNQ